MTEIGPNWDVVHTIDDWYDGPREGAADFQDQPYWYRSVYLDSPEWNRNEDRFELTLMTPEALAWTLERDQIFRRWDLARNSGALVWKEGDLNSFGALPEEMVRYRELNEKVEAYLAKTKPEYFLHGEFEPGCKRVHWRPVI